MQLFTNLDKCKIGSEGVKFLTKGKWQILKQIYICKT
jgi:hypothetical protein